MFYIYFNSYKTLSTHEYIDVLVMAKIVNFRKKYTKK